MKKTTLIGKVENNEMLLPLLAEKNLLRDQMLYQVTEVKRGGICARNMDAKLKDADPGQAVGCAEVLLTAGPLNDRIKTLIGDREAVSFEAYAKCHSVSTDCPAIEIAVSREWFSDVLGVMRRLAETGYKIYLEGKQPQLDQILSLTKLRGADAEAKIILSIQDDSDFTSVQLLEKEILDFLRKTVPMQAYFNQFTKNYINRWKYNLHVLSDGSVFLSCSRTVRPLTKTQCQLLEMSDLNQAVMPEDLTREELETLTALCMQEENKSEYFKAIISTGLARIENYDDMIVSFVGSHRCNMKCKYCFSDHTHEALSAMNEDDMLEITDLLTSGRPNLNLHVDNNLAGEPLEDEKAVKKRHNALIAYHKIRGIVASFGLLTNGTLLKPEHLSWLRYHMPYLGFSLDGDRKTHDRIRQDAGGNPTYDRAVRGIKMVQEADWPVETGVSTVISRYNLDISSLQAHIREDLLVPNIVMKPVRASADSDFALNYGDLEQLQAGYRDFFSFLLNQGRQGDLKPLFTMLQPLDYAGRFLLRVFMADRVIVKRCGSGEHIFSVADNGKIYPCDSFNGIEGMEIASLEEGMHNRPGYRVPFVTDDQDKFGCGSCWARYLCGGICQYVQYLNHYEYNDVLKFECGLSRFLIELSILFWEEAHRTWDKGLLVSVEQRMHSIGFRPMRDKDAFVYAPC